jgi:PhnB protein
MTPADPAPGPAEARLAPWLSVPDGPRALEWYAAAFGAVERYRLDDDGRVVVARLAIGGADFWFGEEPGTEGGGPVRMIVTVTDPEALFARAVAAGAAEVAPVAEEHGWRVGRLADPFGHHWEIGTELG